MRQGPNPRRLRGRGNGRRPPNPRSHTFESNGPEVKVRGNAQQVVEKYLALARDATSAGDRVAAESYFQHAEHYYRIMTANGEGSEDRGTHAHPGRRDQPGAPDGQPRHAAGGGDDPVPAPGVPAQDPASAPQPDTQPDTEDAGPASA